MVYSQLAAAPTANVGTDHPIALPRITLDKVKKTFGVKLAQGNLGTIYRVNVDGDASRRVYKATSQSKFKDGNTIVISKIASDQRVAPTFYSAFILDPTEGQDGKSFVVIEMDDAGKSLGSELKELEEAAQVEEDKKEAEKEKSVKKRSPSAEQEQMQEFLKIAQARMVA